MAGARLRHFRVRNFERFQHYKSKEGSPKWIKLYRELLFDYDFGSLDDTAKGHLMLIWLLASQTKGRFPYDARRVAEKIGARSKVDLDALIEAGFLILEDKSESTLERVVNSALEPKAQNTSTLVSSDLSSLQEEESEGKPEPITPEDLLEGWNDHCAPLGLSKVAMLSATRRQKASARIREHGDAEFWNTVLGRIRGSPFLLGHKNGNGNGEHKNWKASFDWLIENDTNCIKVFEGRYVKET
jgi:hypothetical protein